MTDPVLEFIEHHCVKGMHWGIRNDRKPTGFRAQSSGPIVDPSLHSSTKTAAKQVASLMSERYGFNITEVKNLKTANPQEYAHGTAAFVNFTPGIKGGEVYVRPEDLSKDLKHSESVGWMKPGTTNVRGLLTHESAHAMFHAEQSVKGILRKRIVGGEAKAREKAMTAAIKQAKKDGIHPSMFMSNVSGYAVYSGSREETEAEMFSQYHWGTHTPNFIKVWGETLHQELGVDPTPFKEVVKHG